MLRAACSSLFLLGLITEAHAAEPGTKTLTDNDLFVVVNAVAGDVAKIPTALDRVTVGLKDGRVTYFSKNEAISCQFASNRDPSFASNNDPLWVNGWAYPRSA